MANRSTLEALRRQRDFSNLRKDGRIVYPCAWLMVSFLPNEIKKLRFGWTVPKYIGTAITRNRLKRWGREYLRKWVKENELQVDINFIFKRRSEEFYNELSHAEFDAALSSALKQIAKRVG